MKKLITIIIFLLLCNVVLGDYDTGGVDNRNTFNTNNIGQWNELFDDTNKKVATRQAPDSVLLTSLKSHDIDNDGVNEIIYYDEVGNDLIIAEYDSNNILLLNDYVINSGAAKGDFQITPDMNNNGIDEIAFLSGTKARIFEYNATLDNFVKITQHAISGGTATAPNWFKCNGEGCFMSRLNWTSFLDYGKIYWFNTTYISPEIVWHFDNVFNNALGTGVMSTATLNPLIDGSPESEDIFMFGYTLEQGGNNYICLNQWSHNSTLPLYQVQDDCHTDIYQGFDIEADRRTDYMSGLTVFDYEDDGTYDIFLGLSTTANTFKLFEYNMEDGTYSDQHPQFDDQNGIMLSNPMVAECFDFPGQNSVALLGYDSVNNEMNLICSQDRGFFGIDDCTYEGITHPNMNVSEMLDCEVCRATHVTEMDGSINSEFINSQGIIDIDSPSGILNCEPDASIIYYHGISGGFIYPDDYEDTGLADLIARDEFNIYYIDDGFTNSNAYISEDCENPCIGTTWKINTTVQVQITASDVNSDNVQTRALLYFNETNTTQDSGWITTASGNTNFHVFVADTITADSLLRVMARDVEHNTSFDFYDYHFAVSSNGLSFGDCDTCHDYEAPPEDGVEEGAPCQIDEECSGDLFCMEGSCVVLPEAGNEDIAHGTKELITIFGISGLMFVLLSIVIGAFVIFRLDDIPDKSKPLGIGLWTSVVLILGAKWSLISGTMVVVLFIIILIGGALVGYNKLTGFGRETQ